MIPVEPQSDQLLHVNPGSQLLLDCRLRRLRRRRIKLEICPIILPDGFYKFVVKILVEDYGRLTLLYAPIHPLFEPPKELFQDRFSVGVADCLGAQ